MERDPVPGAARNLGALRLTQPEPDIRWPSPPGRTAAWVFHRYVRRLARRHFCAAWWWPPDSRPDMPTLMIANHTNWWDGFMAVLITRALGRRFQVLMEARHLDRYRAFLRVGALPLHRGHPAHAREDLQRALGYLDDAAALWVFPQGARRPATEPIGRLESGAAWLALSAGRPVWIQPMAFRYAYRGEQLPEAFAWAGKGRIVKEGSRRSETRAIEASLRDALDRLDDRLRSERLDDARLLVPGRLSVNKRLDRARHAVGLLDGPFEARNG